MREWQDFIRRENKLEFLHFKNPFKLLQKLHGKAFLSKIIITLNHHINNPISTQPTINALLGNSVTILLKRLPK